MSTSSTGSTGGAAQRVTGLASGFDTQSIVESLMALEKQPLNKLDVKKQTEELKLQAFQAVNTYLLKFRTSVSTLSSSKLWNSKAAVSTNEKSITATANEYAVNGTYNFRVAQLATVTQYMSKGVASSKTALVKQEEGETAYKLGEINLSSAKVRVDNSAKLEQLNGGKGVFRGSVRVTDAKGNTSVIDLSGCDTVDDVVNTLNESSNAQINASIKDGALYIQDASGGGGTMKVQNVGSGTTATDLGIAGSSDTGEIKGRNVYTMGNDTSLQLLNDGLGVEEGTLRMYATDNDGYSLYMDVDVNGCENVGDIVKRINGRIQELVDANTIHPEGGMSTSDLEGLYFAVSEDGTSFALTGTKAGTAYQFINYNDPLKVGKMDPAGQLGLNGAKVSTADDQELKFDRVLGGMNSPMLKNLNGANYYGVGLAGEDTQTMLPVDFNDATPIEALNGGKGYNLNLPVLQIVAHEGGKAVSDLDKSMMNIFEQVIKPGEMETFLSTAGQTVGTLKKFINDKIADYANDPANNAAALKGLYIDFDSDGAARMSVFGAQGGYTYEIGGTLGTLLGVSRGYEKNTAVGKYTDEKSAEYEDWADAVKDFYNVGKDSLLQNNAVIKTEIDPDKVGDTLTTMADLIKGMHGKTLADFGGDETQYEQAVKDWADHVDLVGVDAALAERFGGEKLHVSGLALKDNGDPTNPLDWEEISVSVDFDQLFDDGFGVKSGVTGATTVKDFMDAVNKQISDGFAAHPANGVGNEGIVNVPKLSLNATADNFAWTNIDHSRVWDFQGDGVGGVDALRLTKDTTGQTSNGAFVFTTQPEHAVAGDLDIRMPAYVETFPIDETTAETLTVGQLNAGYGLQFSGNASDKMKFDLGGSGKSIEFTMGELASYMKNYYNESANETYKDVTVADYVRALNDLIGDKLDEYNTNNGLTGSDALDFKLKVGKDGIEASGFKNITNFAVSGELAKEALTGIAAGGPAEFKEGATYEIGTIIAGEVHPQDGIKGLGQIAITLGNGSEVLLNTDGLDKFGTLDDLIAKLNSELDKLGKGYYDDTNTFIPPVDEAYAEIRFTINDSGTGVAVENNSNKRLTFHDTTKNGVSDAQYLAQDLGLVGSDNSSTRVEAYSFYNGKSLNRSMISRATSVDEYFPATKENGSIQIQNSAGDTTTIDLKEAKTIGDILDAINDQAGFLLNVYARINEKGDGITFYENWGDKVPDYGVGDVKKTDLSVSDVDGGTLGKSLGLTGTGHTKYGFAAFEGSLNTTIDVMSSDTLESLMYRISSSGNYKCAIINDGSKTNPYRLTISSAATGESNDFVIDTDIDLFGFTQTSRAKDSKVLYGDPNSAASPVMLSSSTNTNSNAILGMTLELKQSSADWTTITVDTDKEKVKEEIKSMVETYNQLSEIITMLDAYDTETGEPGILFGDSNVRSLMDDINEYFYAIFNPQNVMIGSVDDDGKQATWSWMDLGVQLTAKQSNSDGTGGWYTTMDLDLDALDDMVASNWDVLSTMLAGQRNVADINLGENVKPTASFNGDLEDGFSVENAINGDYNKGSYGVTNGIQAKGTIEEGNNQYTIWFQQPTTMSRMSIYHYSSDTALKDFTVEYLDAKTGKWEKLREIEGNASDSNHLGMALPTTVQAIRITADSTNAKDDKFRLLDVQVWEETGLAGKLNQHTTTLGDSQTGFLAERNTEIQSNIRDIKEQMERLNERLTAKEEALWRKFTAMEKALGSMQNQSSYFDNMMGSMSSSK